MEEDGALPSSSITSRKPFVYQPLDDTPNSFRLLEILPEKADGRIQLRIRHDKMPTTYKCLSYMWGDATESHEVLMNGSTSPIRKNLHDFLEMARVRFPNEKLWIDALCINQSDNAERGHQIQRMGDIYRGASEVLAWLGNTYALSKAFSWINAERDSLPEDVRDGLKELCTHPYWNRTWITQEVLLGQSVRVLHAYDEINWRRIGSAINATSVLEMEWSRKAALEETPAMVLSFVERKLGVPRPLSSILRRRTNSQCSDARDRIYGLLALASGGSSFAVNYDEDATSLFWRACRHFDAWNVRYMGIIWSALELHSTALAEFVNGQSPVEASLLVAQISFPKYPRAFWLCSRKKFRCKYCDSKVGFTTRHDILLCVRGEYRGNWFVLSPHAVLSPKQTSKTDQSFTITFIIPDGPNDMGKAVRTELEADKLLRYEWGTWTPVKDLETVRRDKGPVAWEEGEEDGEEEGEEDGEEEGEEEGEDREEKVKYKILLSANNVVECVKLFDAVRRSADSWLTM